MKCIMTLVLFTNLGQFKGAVLLFKNDICVCHHQCHSPKLQISLKTLITRLMSRGHNKDKNCPKMWCSVVVFWNYVYLVLLVKTEGIPDSIPQNNCKVCIKVLLPWQHDRNVYKQQKLARVKVYHHSLSTFMFTITRHKFEKSFFVYLYINK